MKLTQIRVQNYRALRDIALPLSRFGCLIGKNNAGKSTVLQAVALFFSGSKLSSKDFFDSAQPIRIEILFEDIGTNDLNRLAPDHREKIESIVKEGRLQLVRYYDTNGSGKFQYVSLVPKDERFGSNRLGALMKGKSKGGLLAAVVEAFPELKDKFQAASITQAQVKEEIEKLAAEIPMAEKKADDCDLPTGIDASIKALLPDPIYIPAVKNLADDVKAKESTPFGKVLAILLDAIEPKLKNVEEFFKELHEKFNRVVQENGEKTDNRLSEVQLIEKTVETYLKQSFANVSLEINIPPPELKTLLSSAELLIDDGVQGGIETKGDGLRRAAVFAILRSYVTLNQPGGMGEAAGKPVMDRHILLFEEPELYLHPSAQKVLYDALSIFSKHNHVLITTHSPNFFGPQATASFVKLEKQNDVTLATRPFTAAKPIDLTDINAKDQFQLICFENNNAAFFFDSVVLVEGDSDYIVIPHVAKLLSPNWDEVGPAHTFIRINGKGSIRRYKDFFSRFGVRVCVVSDLDLLVSGFSSIEPSDELKRCQSALLALVNQIAERDGLVTEPTQGEAKEAQKKTELLGRWRAVKEAWSNLKAEKVDFETFESAVNGFFAWERKDAHLKVLQECDEPALLASKRELLSKLRQNDVFVLERGALEAYYPPTINRSLDKPTQAQHFCNTVNTRDEMLALCGDCHDQDGSTIRKEFEIICDGLFGASRL